jgi:hypothetical protein
MMIRSLLILLAASGVIRAQPPLYEPPQGFYKARGNPVVVAWSVDRTSLREDETLTATLTVEGATNPQDVIRPDLSKLKPFADRFQVENAPGPNFIYKLRPRNAEVNRLPTLEFWYDSGVKIGNPFKKTTAKGIELTVTPAPKTQPQATPLLEPDRLFRIESTPEVLAKPWFEVGIVSWIGLFLLGILASIGWYVLWRRMYPDGARLAKLRRNRAMRRAVNAIARADGAEAVAAAVMGYLRSRCPLSAGCETPSDVAAALTTAGIPEAAAVAEFLRRCDEARFAPTSDNAVSLADEARELLARLEAAE